MTRRAAIFVSQFLAINVALFVSPIVIRAFQASRDAAAPHVLMDLDSNRTPLGLLYTPDTLSALISHRTVESIDSRIADAARQRTPIAVMWIIPFSSDLAQFFESPYRMVIVDRPTDVGSVSQIEPLWILQGDTESLTAALARLDGRTRFQKVGAVAAFQADAFSPGRKIGIYLGDERSGPRRWAAIQWNGARP